MVIIYRVCHPVHHVLCIEICFIWRKITLLLRKHFQIWSWLITCWPYNNVLALSEPKLEQHVKEEPRTGLHQRVKEYLSKKNSFHLNFQRNETNPAGWWLKAANLILNWKSLKHKLRWVRLNLWDEGKFCQAWPRIVATAAKNNIGAPAARALLEEVHKQLEFLLTIDPQVQTTKKEIKATSAEIEENRAALASFLACMRVQVAWVEN